MVATWPAAAATPTLTTQASAPGFPVGVAIFDTATLGGGQNPTGTLTFNLFGPDNATCSGAPIFTSTKPVTGNANYTSDSFTTTQAGTYRWVTSYSGDANNNAAVSPCTSEVLTVDRGTPSLSTTPNVPSGAVGVAIHDTAKVSGGSNPTGTVTFALYGPGDSTCQTNLLANQPSFTVSLTNGQASSPDFTTTGIGVYQWVATYNGDANNAAASGACGDTTEQVVTAAVLAETSLPPTGSLALTLLIIGFPLLAIGTLLILLARRRREGEI
jgi:hypothetical protein